MDPINLLFHGPFRVFWRSQTRRGLVCLAQMNSNPNEGLSLVLLCDDSPALKKSSRQIELSQSGRLLEKVEAHDELQNTRVF